MGAAGDMLLAALVELLDEGQQEKFIERMNSLGLPGIHVVKNKAEKCGIIGTQIDIHIHGSQELSADVHYHEHEHHHHHDEEHHHEHHSHSGLDDISEVIRSLPVSLTVQDNAIAVYNIIADAESKVHGREVSQVHFHEVGALDAVADITGVCMLIEMLSPDEVIVSPIHLGSGFVKCAHGVLPVPAPATAYILRGIPAYSSSIKGELCTPTGAALLKHFGTMFTTMPVMGTEKIGYGMGKKDFEAANCLRAFFGEAIRSAEVNDEIAELSCNLDDMTGEAIGYAIDVLFDNGALDVFTVPVQMKKNRPGVILTCLCGINQADQMAALILKHTSTFGVRKNICGRYKLSRTFSTVSTEYGDIRLKIGEGYGIKKIKPEYEDAAAAAKSHNVSVNQVYKRL